MEKQIITRENLKAIHDVACDGWKTKLAVGTRVIFSRIKDIEKNGMFATIVKNDLTYPKMYEVLTHGGGYYSTEPNEVYVNKKLLKRWPSTPQVNSIREKLEE